ncbi:MAG TPA: universal stress protein [Candidatus Melainabacteria bacterium]|nr:universal stress protein [Candidatus Melainabacteria bacterium]HIN66495.1 universal stress protein [Candidatus Obscuribacterales bacterium]
MKVLISIDESEYAAAIAQFVVDHQWDKDTEFTVMSVVEPLKVGNVMAVLPGPILDEMMEKRQENAQQVVEDTVRCISKIVSRDKIRKQIIEGSPTEEIMKEITISKPDMLLIGSHGRHGLDRIILGSVSLFLVSHAPCSVIVIKPKRAGGEKKQAA